MSVWIKYVEEYKIKDKKGVLRNHGHTGDDSKDHVKLLAFHS